MLQRERVLKALEALSRRPPSPELTHPAEVAQPEALEAVAPAVGDVAPAPGPTAPDLPPLAEILGGEWRETASGRVFVKETRLAPEHLHGHLPLTAARAASRDALRIALGHTDPPPADRLAFFDTETTGLSGGTGTYIFLAGVGSLDAAGFHLRQYFLPSLAGEPAMLRALAEDLGRFEGIVTYNGRAYDVPLLETRNTLARIPRSESRLRGEHFDLLRAARRLYRGRLERCSLVDVEAEALGVRREDDVPGHLIPGLYFDFIRAGRAAPLRGVLRHNALDILSLAGFLARLGKLFDAARADHTTLDPRDAVQLARWLDLEGDRELAGSLYRSALPRLEGREQGEPLWRNATARFALYLKRAGSRAEALPLWTDLWHRGDLAAGLELAKHLEHADRAPPRAAEVVRALLEQWPEDDMRGRRELAHRLARLERKIAVLDGAHAEDAPASS